MTDPLGTPPPSRAPRTAGDRSIGDATRAIRAASRTPVFDQRPTAVPIFQSATFSTDDAASLATATMRPATAYTYSRISNPTTAALGSAYAELAGGAAGLALASGMAAIHAAIASVVQAGDRVVAPTAAYGTTRTQLTSYFSGFGVRVELVDMTDLDAVAAALAAEPTRLLYAESSANPTTAVADHAALAELAHRHGARYVVDNTFASAWVCRPLEFGADIVVESATKYLGGHSDVIAGVAAGAPTDVEAMRAVQITTGATLGPMDAFLVLRGILSFPVRMERHGASALALARRLEALPGVARVLYPGLPSHPQHAVVERLWRTDNSGGMLAFEVPGGRMAGQAIIDALAIPERTASLGSVHTMVVHPPSTSHRQLSDAELAAGGIRPGLLRVSVGLEDVEDLAADLASAIATAPTSPAPTSPASAGAIRRSRVAERSSPDAEPASPGAEPASPGADLPPTAVVDA